MIISMTINLPRQLALEVSPCHTGAAVVNVEYQLPLLQHTCRCIDTISYSSYYSAASSVVDIAT